MSETLGSVAFWRIFHSLLRGGKSEEEFARAREACAWAVDNANHLRNVCVDFELTLVSEILTYWERHKDAPNYRILHEVIEQKDKNEGILAALEEYDSLKEGFHRHADTELAQVLLEKTEEFQRDKLNHVLKVAKQITASGWEQPKTKQKLSGTVDAVRYLVEQIENGVIINGRKARGGILQETVGDLQDVYLKNKKDNEAGRHRIYTGIDKLDASINFKRGDFVGILGYAGTRKTSFARTCVYNAAMQGFNPMHVTLEQTEEEERVSYGIIHAHHDKWKGQFKGITKKAFDDGTLTPDQEDALFNTVLPDLSATLPGKIYIRQPTEGTAWEAIKHVVEMVDQSVELDMLLIDYLTLVDVSAMGRNPKEAMENVIKDAKQFALNFRHSRGLVLLTPIQGNRDGFTAACEAEGKWEMDGVYMYSEFDKSLDTCMFTHLDDALKSENQIKLGTCKTRRSEGVPPFTAMVKPECGLIRNLVTGEVANIDVTLDSSGAYYDDL